MDKSPNNNQGDRTLQKKKEEQRVIDLIKLIRETEDNDAFTQIWVHVSKYINAFKKKYKIAGCDEDEIEQQCLCALRYKAIADFDPQRGNFKSFASLCIQRHLCSIIKSNKQQKRTTLNVALSLDENRSENGEDLSLVNLVLEESLSADKQAEKDEIEELKKSKLISNLSKLEREVFKLYIKRYHYDEIVDQLQRIFPSRTVNKKVVDNSLVRCRIKAQKLAQDWDIFFNK